MKPRNTLNTRNNRIGISFSVFSVFRGFSMLAFLFSISVSRADELVAFDGRTMTNGAALEIQKTLERGGYTNLCDLSLDNLHVFHKKTETTNAAILMVERESRNSRTNLFIRIFDAKTSETRRIASINETLASPKTLETLIEQARQYSSDSSATEISIGGVSEEFVMESSRRLFLELNLRLGSEKGIALMERKCLADAMAIQDAFASGRIHVAGFGPMIGRIRSGRLILRLAEIPDGGVKIGALDITNGNYLFKMTIKNSADCDALIKKLLGFKFPE